MCVRMRTKNVCINLNNITETERGSYKECFEYMHCVDKMLNKKIGMN